MRWRYTASTSVVQRQRQLYRASLISSAPASTLQQRFQLHCANQSSTTLAQLLRCHRYLQLTTAPAAMGPDDSFICSFMAFAYAGMLRIFLGGGTAVRRTARSRLPSQKRHSRVIKNLGPH
jgi:hypothetical protein